MGRSEHNLPSDFITDAYYRHALDNTAIVAITDRAGTITYVNDKFCEISGYTRDELIGRNHRILNSGTHPKSFFTEMFRTIARGETWRRDICNRAKDGSLYWVDATVVPVLDDAGAVKGYVSIHAHITARKLREQDSIKAYEQIKEISDLKSEFFANISHEIRTPLTAILGYADLLRDDSIGPEERQAHLNTIRRNGEHLLSMINDLIESSKIEANQTEIERADIELIDTLAEVTSFMQMRACGKNLSLDLEFETDVPRTIHTDQVRLRQILVNLVGNALKFTELGGARIIVGLEDSLGDNPMLRVTIADTGIGIEQGTIERLFLPFFQADATKTRKYGGTGLGLYISQRFASMLGGKITVHSDPGAGSRFILRIPTGPLDIHDILDISEAQEAARRQCRLLEQQDTPRQQRCPLAGASVLLVEDGPDNQRLLAHFVRKSGADVTLAENGRIAVELIEQGRRFDAILMDVYMPEMDGIEATKRLRAIGCPTPIIALTAHATSEDCDQCLAAGCDDFLTKPIGRKRLVSVIAEWIDQDKRNAA